MENKNDLPFSSDEITTSFGDWYNSTQGPGISKTLVSILGSIIPVAVMVVSMKTGAPVDSASISVLQSNIAIGIYVLVYLFFVARAAISYVRAKNILQARYEKLSSPRAQRNYCEKCQCAK